MIGHIAKQYPEEEGDSANLRSKTIVKGQAGRAGGGSRVGIGAPFISLGLRVGTTQRSLTAIVVVL